MSPMTTDDPTITAHARAGDPETSHDAAAAQSPAKLSEAQRAVLDCLTQFGPMHDVHLVQAYQRWYKHAGWPAQSDSGIRTRRKELVAQGHVVLDHTGTLSTGRKAKVHRALQGTAAPKAA